MEFAAAEGTRFGALVQDWVEGRDPGMEEDGICDDPWFWYETLRSLWNPPRGAVCEVAMGLSTDGDYVAVEELQPHVYTVKSKSSFDIATEDRPDPVLATAGRLDIGWVYGNEDVAVVLDLKRSSWRYGDPETVPQLMALGCMWARMNACNYMRVGLYGAKDGVFSWGEVQLVTDVLPEVLAIAALPEDRPLPGPWCHGCYELKGCLASGLRTEVQGQ